MGEAIDVAQSADFAPSPLSREALALAFADLHPPLSHDAAKVEAERCYFCHDAPCVTACPTAIDIPGFIRGIVTGNMTGAGQRILDANILGGTCARVCPTEILCEGACVRTAQQGKPVEIGALQRVATDHVFAQPRHPFARAAATGRHIAVVGAGPAGLSCAHALARQGHDVTIFESRPKPGGLNEFGIAAYKMADDFAAREVEFVLDIGGITIVNERTLGRDLHLSQLRVEYDAVFLGVGQAGVKSLALAGETLPGIMNAVDFIAELRQTSDLATLPIGRRVVVIGGGNTAIDASTQAKRLGAEVVTLVYRRGRAEMSATTAEQDWAQTNNVAFRFWAAPLAFEGEDHVQRVTFARMAPSVGGGLQPTGAQFSLEADMVLKAVGQNFQQEFHDIAPAINAGRIVIDALKRQTSIPGVFAGGDCVEGQDLTVQAVEDGKRAARGISAFLAEGVTDRG
jgi:dihydropyrimidine dehydrogenase (NAD+) subunit PreT